MRIRYVVALALVGFAGFALASYALGAPLVALGPGPTETTSPTTETTSPTTETTSPTTTQPPTTTTEPTITAPTTTAPTTTAPTTGTTDGTTTAPTAGIVIAPVTPAPGAGDARVPDVVNVRAILGDQAVVISWDNPAGPGFDHVEITRTPGKNGNPQGTVYRGRGTTLRDGGLLQGAEYRYVLAAVDDAGNRSNGIAVIVVGKDQLLLTPREGATLTRAPILRWIAVPDADYYNVQIFRGTKKPIKVLSFWPRQPRVKLPKTWRFNGRTQQLRTGSYTWYVWPGFGRLVHADYGDMLGKSEFTIATR